MGFKGLFILLLLDQAFFPYSEGNPIFPIRFTNNYETPEITWPGNYYWQEFNSDRFRDFSVVDPTEIEPRLSEREMTYGGYYSPQEYETVVPVHFQDTVGDLLTKSTPRIVDEVQRIPTTRIEENPFSMPMENDYSSWNQYDMRKIPAVSNTQSIYNQREEPSRNQKKLLNMIDSLIEQEPLINEQAKEMTVRTEREELPNTSELTLRSENDPVLEKNTEINGQTKDSDFEGTSYRGHLEITKDSDPKIEMELIPDEPKEKETELNEKRNTEQEIVEEAKPNNDYLLQLKGIIDDNLYDEIRRIFDNISYGDIHDTPKNITAKVNYGNDGKITISYEPQEQESSDEAVDQQKENDKQSTSDNSGNDNEQPSNGNEETRMPVIEEIIVPTHINHLCDGDHRVKRQSPIMEKQIKQSHSDDVGLGNTNKHKLIDDFLSELDKDTRVRGSSHGVTSNHGQHTYSSVPENSQSNKGSGTSFWSRLGSQISSALGGQLTSKVGDQISTTLNKAKHETQKIFQGVLKQ